MERINSIININFIDFDGKATLYDQIEVVKDKEEIIPKRMIIGKKLSEKFYYDYSFSTMIQLKLSNSKNEKVYKVYEIEIFKDVTNEVYLLIKDSFPYQIDLYAQTTSFLITKENKISISIGNFLIELPLNLIDKVRFKSLVNFCNVPLITFNCLKDGYSISKETKRLTHLKFCFYFLEDSDKKYMLTIHKVDNTDSNEKTKKIAKEVVNHLDFIEQKVETIKHDIITLLEENQSNPTNMTSFVNFFIKLDKYFISINKQYPLLFDITNIPLRYLPFTEQVLNILYNAYFFSILKQTTTTAINKMKTEERALFDQMKNVDNLYLAYKMIGESLEKDDSSIEIKIKKVSVYYACVNKSMTLNETCDLPLFFDIETNCKNNFYNKATLLLKECVINLENDSFLSEPLMLINSNVSSDINISNKNGGKEQFEICILNIDNIKKQILSTLIPSFLFRWDSYTFYTTFIDIRSQCVIINEKRFFGYNHIKMNSVLEMPSKSYIATSVLIELLNSILGYSTQKVNIKSNFTPEQFYINGKFENLKETGSIIEHYLASSEHILLMKHSQSYKLSSLQDYRLFTSKSNEELRKAINKIEKTAKNSIFNPIDMIDKNNTKASCVQDPIDYTKTYVYTMKTFDLGYQIDDTE